MFHISRVLRFAYLDYIENPNLIYAILRSRKRFESLQEFTLESAQEELERQKAETESSNSDHHGRRSSVDTTLRSSISARSPNLSNVPEEHDAFAIGDDEDVSEGEEAASASQPLQPKRPISTQSIESSHGTASISSSTDDVPPQLRGMSEKARGKMPVGTPSFSRQNSMTSLHNLTPVATASGGAFQPSAEWIESWQPELPLHTILTLISELGPQLPPNSLSSSSTTSATNTNPDDTSQALAQIRRTSIPPSLDPSPIRVHLFEWSPLALGWYESLLWGFVFSSESQISKGSAGIWNSSGIRLFTVKETAPMTPSLLAPRGAVDAVGSNLVSRIGNLNLRGTGGRSGSGAQGQNQGRGQMSVRDV